MRASPWTCSAPQAKRASNNIVGCSGKSAPSDEGIFLTNQMPPFNVLAGGEFAWRQHDGGHTAGPNVESFMEWADKFIGHTPPERPAVANETAAPIGALHLTPC